MLFIPLRIAIPLIFFFRGIAILFCKGITISKNRSLPNKGIAILMELSFYSKDLFREPNKVLELIVEK
jgi:hypothetical protein